MTARGALLRLAGPLQAWGAHSTFTERDSAAFPTRSALVGLVAAALGRTRTASPDEFRPLAFTVRIDRPGQRIVDFHTVGGGLPAKATVPKPDGGHRPEGGGTLVSRRHYLADAAFTVAIEGPAGLVDASARALASPVWAPYLGRRACPPDGAVLMAADVAEPARRLRDAVPLARQRPPGDAPTVPVQFVEEIPVGGAQGSTVTELWDVPLSLERLDRRYGHRSVRLSTEDLPATLCAGYGTGQLRAVHQFVTSVSKGGAA
jgi:CRISPR system Cascade subunit CasD